MNLGDVECGVRAAPCTGVEPERGTRAALDRASIGPYWGCDRREVLWPVVPDASRSLPAFAINDPPLGIEPLRPRSARPSRGPANRPPESHAGHRPNEPVNSSTTPPPSRIGRLGESGQPPALIRAPKSAVSFSILRPWWGRPLIRPVRVRSCSTMSRRSPFFYPPLPVLRPITFERVWCNTSRPSLNGQPAPFLTPVV